MEERKGKWGEYVREESKKKRQGTLLRMLNQNKPNREISGVPQ